MNISFVIQVAILLIKVVSVVSSSSSLFEQCDETFNLDMKNKNVTISSNNLHANNVTSCRYTIIVPVNYVVRVTCILRFDQPDSTSCPLKRFFVSIDGIKSLHRAHNFCNKNGTARIIKRRSVMNRLVMAYVTKRDLEDENFTCIASRVVSKCDCGWSRRVIFTILFYIL
jgi:hypothetical protein